MPESFSRSASGAPEPVPDSVKIQILATEHWGLLATRSMLWNEIFTRAGMFLTTLSAAVVAIALVAQASDFGTEYRVFALVLLPVVLFLGLVSYLRLGSAAELEAWTLFGMNRLRHAYLEIAPDLEPYLINSHYDDWDGMLQSAGQYRTMTPLMALTSTPAILAVLNAVIAGVIVSLAFDQLGAGAGVAVTLGLVAGMLVATILLGVIPWRMITEARRSYVPRFPRQDASAGGVPSHVET